MTPGFFRTFFEAQAALGLVAETPVFHLANAGAGLKSRRRGGGKAAECRREKVESRKSLTTRGGLLSTYNSHAARFTKSHLKQLR